MACNARRKGASGELEAAKALNAVLPHAQARRAQQYCGHETAADLVCEGLDGVMVEVKRRQSMNIHKVVKESQAHCTEGMLPMILHRKDNEEWLLTIRLEDLPLALKKFLVVKGVTHESSALPVGQSPDPQSNPHVV